MNNRSARAILITGGTKGIGLGTGLAFARQGAHTILTYKWGSADPDEVRSRFSAERLPTPLVIEADVVNSDDTTALLERIHEDFDRIDSFISNVSYGLIVKDLADYSFRSLMRSIEYSTWPLVEYPRRIREVFGQYPRYIIGLSSGGPDHVYKNYDFVAVSKAALETICRYLNYRLFSEDVRINIVRAGLVRTDSLWATFGSDFERFAERFNPQRQFTEIDDVANAIVALCSGLMDGVSGQIVNIDRGTTFFNNLMGIFEQSGNLEL
ncbi:MAG TPA: SDR family oxidoreductase [Terriglobia bacterium]|nr:SDR family oxidoreductase [Terriglobia bacterium]